MLVFLNLVLFFPLLSYWPTCGKLLENASFTCYWTVCKLALHRRMYTFYVVLIHAEKITKMQDQALHLEVYIQDYLKVDQNMVEAEHCWDTPEQKHFWHPSGLVDARPKYPGLQVSHPGPATFDLQSHSGLPPSTSLQAEIMSRFNVRWDVKCFFRSPDNNSIAEYFWTFYTCNKCTL